MKKILLILLILVASLAQATKWYASPTGGGNGTIGSPYTMAVARTVASFGDTIVPLDGVYTISSIYNVPLGVSIIGSDSANVIFNCSHTSTNFNLESATILDGNQLLQGFTMNGNMVGSIGIYITKRNNVDINAISVKNFKDRGIHNQNPTGGLAPSITGCDVTNSRIVNCTKYTDGGSYGNLYINGCKDFVVLNNYVEASFRSGDSAGFAMKLTAIANCTIDGNDARVIGHNDGLRWAFALESNHNWGGVTYTNNNFQGIVDFAGYHTFAGTYEFSMKFLYNTVGHPELTYYIQTGMLIEATGTTGDFSGVEIAYNRFKNVTYGITIENSYANSVFQNINIHHNIFAPLGVLGQTYNYGIGIRNGSSASISSTIRDLYMDNNVFVASNVAGTRQSAAIELPIRSTARNIRARNNIMIGFDNAAIMTRYPTGILDSVYLQNNIAFGNEYNNDPRWFGIVPTHLFSTNNLKVDPLFVRANADYHLQTTSPAINAGLDLGYLIDFDSNPIGDTSDIGAYEYMDENPEILAIVVLDNPHNLTSRGITIYAYVATDGGGTISERGIVWNTSANPTVSNNKQTAGNGIGVYKNVVSTLLPSTTYYIRAYAINEAGTAYSPQLIVTTKPSSKMGSMGKSMHNKGNVFKY